MSRDPRVDAYIAAAQPFAQPILNHVRARVHAVVPGAEEAIKWGMPAYLKDGKILLITAAFKAHAALNFWRGESLMSSHDSVGAMGQFGKLKSLAELPEDKQLDRLIGDAAHLAATSPAPRKPKAAPASASEPHPDFTAALDAAPRARAHFDAFAPSHRREYVSWINEAKRDETRARRIASAIIWLTEGKKQNWKYAQR